MALFKLFLEVYAKRITANMSLKKMKSLLLIARFFFLCQSLVLRKEFILLTVKMRNIFK